MANADQVADALEDFVSRLTVKIALDITANLQEITPVDTGWARASWRPGVGVFKPRPAPAPDSADGVSAAGATQAADVASIAAEYQFPQPITIASGVPYMQRLNDGYSLQAPKGFVQDAIRLALTRDLAGFR